MQVPCHDATARVSVVKAAESGILCETPYSTTVFQMCEAPALNPTSPLTLSHILELHTTIDPFLVR